MARIPVEKKEGAGTPWWLWLLGLLLLIGLIWLLAEAFDSDEVEEPIAQEPVVTEPVEPMTGGAITSLTTILDDENPQNLVGREVNLTGVTASPVTGDSTYWVYNPDEGVDRRVFVVLYGLGESRSGPGTGADGAYNVDAGENMAVEGVVQRVQPANPDTWGVTGADAQELREGQVYIRARDLRNL